jgi:hypothetical protein
MIRVAIAGLALADTWEALQAEGWDEGLLIDLQKDWESVNLSSSFEKGILGERALGEAVFSVMHSVSSGERVKYNRFLGIAGSAQLKTPRDYFDAYVVMPLWGANADADEMFFLQHHQRTLESIRKLRTGVPWLEISTELNSHHAMLNQAFSTPVARFRYLISAVAIPNSLKAAGTCVRNETQRRLTVAAIALARHRLRDGRYPPTLETLVPQFLSAVPIDLMSAKPLGYHLNPDGSFTLYSVGEDGRDDGGDATSSTVTNRFDLWSGRDAVWPLAATKN